MDDETRELLIKKGLLFSRNLKGDKILSKITGYENGVYTFDKYEFDENDWFKKIVDKL